MFLKVEGEPLVKQVVVHEILCRFESLTVRGFMSVNEGAPQAVEGAVPVMGVYWFALRIYNKTRG